MIQIVKELQNLTLDRNTKQNTEYAVRIYNLILSACALAHMIFCFIFLWMKIPFLAYFNIGSVICYIILFFQVPKKRYAFIITFSSIEVCSFSIIATIMLGWNCGFMYLVVCLIAICFNFPLKKKRTPYIYCIINILVFIAVRIYTMDTARIHPMIQADLQTQNKLFILNICLSFFMILLTSGLNTASVNFTQMTLLEKNKDLQHLADFDPLTNLLNRRGMFKILEQTMQDKETSGTPFSVIIGDIDDFKVVNDTYGHECGDFILKQIAKTISSYTRNGDYVCRWGGEEFLILFSDTCSQDACAVMNRIRMIIDDTTYSYNDKDVSITMTFGICDCNQNYSLNEIIMEADNCLYEGKRAGKNRVVAR